MLHKPKLKSFLTVFPIGNNVWGLRGGADELWRIKLQDENAVRTFSAVLPYLDGKHTIQEIVQSLKEGGNGETAILQLLHRMMEASLLEEADALGLSEQEEQALRAQISFFARYTAEGGAQYQSRLQKSCVAVVGRGYFATSLARQLAGSGFGEIVILSHEPESIAMEKPFPGLHPEIKILKLNREQIWPEEIGHLPGLLIFAQEGEDPQLTDALDTFSKALTVPWLLVRVIESHLGWIGPLFVPGETACYKTLEARAYANLSFFPEHQAYTSYLASRRESSSSCGTLHPFFDLVSAMAAVEAIKFLSGFAVPHLAGRFITISMKDWDTELHEVFRIPQMGLDSGLPELFAWKELPNEAIEGHKAGSIYSRRA